MKTQKKEYDCIQIKRDAQSKIYETIKRLTPEEEIAYFRKSVETSKFSKWWNSASSRVELSETS
mgnify:CR=1 FL=1